MNLIGYSDDKYSLNILKNIKNYSGWNVRVAARAILVDKNKKIALMHVGQRSIYKLPGGGVDQQENLELAVAREILEETGCHSRLTHNLGTYIENREHWKLFQISFCYIAEVLSRGTPNLTIEEKAEDFFLVWADNIEKALNLISENSSDGYDDQFIKKRDSSIIKKAIEVLKQ